METTNILRIACSSMHQTGTNSMTFSVTMDTTLGDIFVKLINFNNSLLLLNKLKECTEVTLVIYKVT